MNIITVTLNPAVDLHYSVEGLTPHGYNKAKFLRRDSGGKGVNLSRALKAGGIESTCYMALGRDGADEFISPLREYGIEPVLTLVPGRARENINLIEEGSETVIATVGPPLCESDLADMEEKLLPIIGSETIIAFAGSISDATNKSSVLKRLFKFRSLGARIVVDSKSFELSDIIPLSPYLIKPNEDEAEALTGIAVSDERSALDAALAIRDMGVESVLLSMGASGAVLASPMGLYSANAPFILPKSTVGAGDSSLAGFLAARLCGLSDDEALRSAVAFGSAACLEEGSLPPRKEVIDELIEKVRVERKM